jgi:hypothetical protein
MSRAPWIGLACVVGLIWTIGHAKAPSEGPVQDDRYIFVQDTNRTIGIYRGGFVLVGKFDARGNFIQRLLYAREATPDLGDATIIRFTEPAKVYEFRSGRLIKGDMLPSGAFVPEVGSKVIPFEDYIPGPKALPIWNLPGYFKKVES